MALRQVVREIRVVYETEGGNQNVSDRFIMEKVTWALDQVNNVTIAVAFFDETGKRLRKVELKEPSPALKLVIDEELGIEEQLSA